MSTAFFRFAPWLLAVAPFLSAAFAGAEARSGITVVNHTPLEIVELSIKTRGEDGAGEATLAVGIVPGNEFTVDSGPNAKATEMSLDLGLARLAFTELAALADQANPRLAVSFAEDDLERPILEWTPEGGQAVRVAGTASWPYVELVGDAENAPAIMALFEADTLGAVRELAAGQAREDGPALLLAVNVGDAPWLARVEPKNEGGEMPGAVGAMVFRTEYNDETLKSALVFLAEAGYRPWFLQRVAGADMETAETVKFSENADQDAEAAMLSATEILLGKRPASDEPGAIDCLFVPPGDFKAAAAGEQLNDVAGLKLRVTNGDMLELRYLPDYSAMMLLTR